MFQRLASDGLSAGGPISYDKHAGTVEATISMGSPVKRNYGTEVLRISPDAVDLSRMQNGGIPLLDHHIDDVKARMACRARMVARMGRLHNE
jgi:hypothetical protein